MAQGYWNDKEATEAAWDQDGWFHSGDIGEIDQNGYLKITDRKKDIIVNAGGKNIAPVLIEGLIKASPCVSQVYVFGDRKPYLVALITLDPESSQAWAKENGIKESVISELSKNPQLIAHLEQEIQERTASLASFEQPKKFSLLKEDFSIENGLLTPTLKLKRKPILERYQSEIDKLYQT